jgi:antitoxin (DNA-binding transcriptional repressor) of toxin-antitoxin stability system
MWDFALCEIRIDPTTPLHYPKPMKVSAEYAQEHFADILTAIDTGEEVELTRPGQPSVRLMLVEPAPVKKQHLNGKRILGAGRGEMRVPSFEEWQAMDTATWTTPERPRAELFGSLKGKIELADDWNSPEMNKEIEDGFEGSEVFPDPAHP